MKKRKLRDTAREIITCYSRLLFTVVPFLLVYLLVNVTISFFVLLLAYSL